MVCGISFVWLNDFLKIYGHEELQENIEGARGEINWETFTATIKAPEGGEAMICVKGDDYVLKSVFLACMWKGHVKNRGLGNKGSNNDNLFE